MATPHFDRVGPSEHFRVISRDDMYNNRSWHHFLLSRSRMETTVAQTRVHGWRYGVNLAYVYLISS